MNKTPALIALILGVVLLVFAGADFFFKQHPHDKEILAQKQEEKEEIAQEMAGGSSSSVAMSTSGSVATNPVKKGISKRNGPVVEEVLITLGFRWQDTRESSLLNLTSPPEEKVQTMVLLKNNDRVALFSWLQSAEVKAIFSSLKEALQKGFSKDVKDLVDESQKPEDAPPRNILSFIDPAISEERILFLRIRTRLYEVHIAKGHDGDIEALMGMLSK